MNGVAPHCGTPVRRILVHRPVLSALLGLSFALAAAGCGGTGNQNGSAAVDGSSSGTAAATAASPTEATSDAYPVAIEHLFGETVIEDEPQRIVTVGLTDQDPVYALGAAPVASQPWYEDRIIYPWAEQAAAGASTEMLPPCCEVDIEAVAAHNPDLILAIGSSGITDEQYDLLSQIAPTVAGAADHEPGATPWQDQTLMIGRALGREAQAEQLVAEVEQQFADAAARHPEWQGAAAVLASQYLEGQLLVYPANSPATSFLERLGFVIAPGLDEFTDDTYGVPALSAERFDLIDVDLVLWDGNRDALEASGLFEVPTFQSLDAVEQGRMVFPFDRVPDALSFRNVLSLPWALERLEPQIVAAFDGDPSTSADPQ